MLHTECNIENDELYNAFKRSKHLLQYYTYNSSKAPNMIGKQISPFSLY